MMASPSGNNLPGSLIDWRQELAAIVSSQKWVMGLTALAIGLGATLIAFRWPPTFRATASILMQGPGSQGMLTSGGNRGSAPTKEDLSSELELLRSPDLMKVTLLALHEATPPALEAAPSQEAAAASTSPPLGPRRIASPHEMHEELRRLEAARALAPLETLRSAEERRPAEEEFVRRLAAPLPDDLRDAWKELKDQLKVELLPATKVIRLTLTGQDPRETERLLDTYLTQYLLYRAHLFNPIDQQRFFSERALLYKQRIESLEDQLLTQAQRTAVVHPEKEIQTNLEIKRDLTRQLNQLSDERLQSEFISAPGLDARMEEIQNRIRAIDDTNLGLQKEILERQRIERDTALGEFSYDLFSRRQEEHHLSRAIAAANLSRDVTILRRADLTAELVFPRPRQVLAVGWVAALLAGLALGCINEYLDDTFKRERDVTQHTGLPVIFSLRKTRTRLK